MKTCIELNDIDCPIKLEQHEGKGKRFRVTYGLQVKDGLGYYEACTELGACIMHALACVSKLDNDGDY